MIIPGVEYSTDGKSVWNKLGTVGIGTNWYDNSPDNNWRVSKLKWHVASIDIPPYAGTMRFPGSLWPVMAA